MSKTIAYLITSSGVDGRALPVTEFATFDEDERDRVYEADKNKAYLSKTEQIIDLEPRKRQALAKLDGLDRLLLDLPPRMGVKDVPRAKP